MCCDGKIWAGILLLGWGLGCAESVEANRAPTAFAGFDVMVAPGEAVVLDGSGSWDPDQEALTYRWRVESKPEASDLALSAEDAADTLLTLVPGVEGRYVVSLTVEDSQAASAVDLVSVFAYEPATVSGSPPPRARAPRNRWALTGDAVTLSGEVLDLSAGRSPRFSWHWIVRPDLSRLGPTDLDGAATTSCTFTPDVAGDYLLSVQVSDGQRVGPPDFVAVRAVDSAPPAEPPVADAGTSAVVTPGATVWLDASDSAGGADDVQPIDAYRWTIALLPAGSGAPFDEVVEETHSTQLAREGLYVFRLEVDSGGETSAPDLVAVQVLASGR